MNVALCVLGVLLIQLSQAQPSCKYFLKILNTLSCFVLYVYCLSFSLLKASDNENTSLNAREQSTNLKNGHDIVKEKRQTCVDWKRRSGSCDDKSKI